MKILIIEDHPIHAQWLKMALEREFSGVSIDVIDSQLSFVKMLPSIIRAPPNIILLDLFVGYSGQNDIEVTEEVRKVNKNTLERGGLNCWELLQKEESTSNIPVIVTTILTYEKFAQQFPKRPMNLHYYQKGNQLEQLIIQIQSIAPELPTRITEEKSYLRQAVDAIDISPGAFGIKVDVKKLIPKKKRKK